MKKALLLTAALVSLTACNDSEELSTPEIETSYLAEHKGLYETAYETAGQAALVRLVVSDNNATLVLTNDLDISTAILGAVDQQSLTFDSFATCTDSAEGFSCDINDQQVNLPQVENQAQQNAMALAGEYSLLVDNDVITITIDAEGAYVAQYQNCHLTGAFSVEDTLLTLSQTGSDCSTNNNAGIAFTSNYSHDPSALEIYLPDSILTGEWIKM